MTLPSVSVKVLTYKRRHWLEECIYYFLSQTYEGEKEMVILNDDPTIKYDYKYPGIKIYNWRYRFESLAEKDNTARGLCKGELLFSWADDDVYEPWALETIIKYLGDKPIMACAPFWKEQKEGKEHRVIRATPTAGSFIIRKDIRDQIGDIPSGEHRDLWLAAQIRELELYNETILEPKEIFFTWRTWSKKHREGSDGIKLHICQLEPGIKAGLLE